MNVEFIKYIENIFVYSEKHPLLFTQFYFWIFFTIVLLGYTFFANKKLSRSAYLLVVSLFFYYKTSGFFFFILIFSTVSDFYIGKWIFHAKSMTNKKLLVALSVLINLGLLVYFKYAYFLTDTINTLLGSDFQTINYFALWANEATGTHFEVSQILLPVGISFFTFQTISYSIDVFKGSVYKKTNKEKNDAFRGLDKPVDNILDFGFYVSFFPQLVAGPIVRARDFIPQISKKFMLSKYDFGMAVFLILKGLMKKIFIGDYIAVNFVDRIFSNPLFYGGFENLMALFGYSLQVYVDFSGYTDIAIGVALLMGFRLPENFNSPYKAKNVGEFWKRWHISLSSWLKDYLYIPMGGNRKGTIFTYISLSIVLAFIVLLSGELLLIPIFIGLIIVLLIFSRLFHPVRKAINTNINIMITMLIGGLWHGASWQFVIWGGLNGVGIIVYKFWRKISPWENNYGRFATIWKIFLTFSFITFTRIFFRSASMEAAKGLMHQVRYNFDLSIIPTVIISYKYVFAVMLLGFITHWLPYRLKEYCRDMFIKTSVFTKVIISIIVVFIIYQSISTDMQPFIYFQF